MKTVIDIFFIYTSLNDNNEKVVEHIKTKTLKNDNTKITLTNSDILFLLKENKESNYMFDDIWYFNNGQRKYSKINNNEPVEFIKKHHANSISIFYHEIQKNTEKQTKKITFKSKKNKTKKNIQIPIKLL
jgi:hypothetical protein